MALADTLEASWYGNGRAPWWAGALAFLYGGVVRLRRRLYRLGWLRSERLPVPVVVVGNITVGGTGKTPLTLAIVEDLRGHGLRPGVVSRGYGGRQREPALLGEAPDPQQFGDEPCLLRGGGVPVAVGRDRPAAARLLLDAGCDVVVADDGLQHYRLARDVEICVIDGVRRFGNQRLLPAGPLREPLQRLRAVDLRVCNGAALEGAYTMALLGDEACALADGHHQPVAAFAGERVHAVAAIGHPQRFFDSLRQRGIEVIEHAFPDHHLFAPGDLDFGDALPVLMTDKDAVKCQRFAQPHWWRVPVRAELPRAFHEALRQRIAQARPSR
ncbi:tetraacyldisaccharide 4'-kinase [Frateuria sp. Soil773]|uniref:tetraacyldisaccharide 4'-kinase n=1 Tax=Frateuria sp. Soil773 TaxID=1736407 RepID=UPI0006F2DD1C|nr:tetraacyldisaccharide 4'-kinase [Frateuria sp. Soil773]KRE92423.1 tetraacyldisaccharide 4'-kinase [Frateuria sp. Soil773]